LWNRLIYGLLSRDDATLNLKGKAVGTFLLRFSDSNPGCIAVAFVDDNKQVAHALIRPEQQGFRILLADGDKLYSSFPELIMKCRKLTILFPDVPKADAFAPEDDQPT